MFSFGEKRPILFEFILVFLSFLVAGIFAGVGSAIGLHPSLSISLARVFVGIVLILIFRRILAQGSPTSGLTYLAPALLFPIWNLFYNLSSGAQLGGTSYYLEALIVAAAPAIFEEVLFRGVFISNLKAAQHSNLSSLLISSVFFSLIHATNVLEAEDLATVALQVGYALVIGLVFGAIYLKNGSLTQLIVAHFLTDFTNHLYLNPATTASTTQIAIFTVLLVAEAAYALWLTCSKTERA